MNARMGPEDVKYIYNILTNNNGNQLLAANLLFQKKIGKLWTWMSPHMTKHQLDYILVNNKWRKSIRNCEAYNTLISLELYHIMVVTTIVEETMSERYEILVEAINMTAVG